ncbi:hypothetical protein O1611_g10469 [Lasiodiplodia mahajangana]|uniref:Uncharacterized protein n=1 Tax=Lasiodiplodia mahajangana TaxID=1108764 RepID=A0ACC2IY52_9PEZI|nr:hypothetical protein O1611_g10469 [Lasiodiplodia mahajangana]
MNDKDVPGNEREGGSVVFEMIARRPVIILQDNDRAPSSITPMNGGYSNAPNPLPPTNNLPNPPAPTVPFNEPPGGYHHTFANTFTNPPPTPMGGTSNGTAVMHSEYPVVPQQ